MHSFTAFIALAALAHAAPVAQKDAPNGYYKGYLEPYMTCKSSVFDATRLYSTRHCFVSDTDSLDHTRYIEIGCSGQQGSQFFTDCCSPMLAEETLEEARLPYCRPNATESSSVASASATQAPVHQSASVDYEAQSAYAEAVTSESAAEASSTWSAEPTSTWSAQPEATTKASSGGSPSGDVKTGGFATYFYQNGNAGACGQYHSDSEYGIAIDSNGYWGQDFSQGSDLCGKVINIKNTNSGATVTATVWDVCPTCNNGNSLDLSVGAFNAIATESEGMVPIEWSFA
jgi:hypothetical protein